MINTLRNRRFICYNFRIEVTFNCLNDVFKLITLEDLVQRRSLRVCNDSTKSIFLKNNVYHSVNPFLRPFCFPRCIVERKDEFTKVFLTFL